MWQKRVRACINNLAYMYTVDNFHLWNHWTSTEVYFLLKHVSTFQIILLSVIGGDLSPCPPGSPPMQERLAISYRNYIPIACCILNGLYLFFEVAKLVLLEFTFIITIYYWHVCMRYFQSLHVLNIDHTFHISDISSMQTRFFGCIKLCVKASHS